MKKKMITYEGVSVFVIAAAFLLAMYASYSVHIDVARVEENTSLNAIESNTAMYGKQINTFFDSRLSEMQSLAACVSAVNCDNHSTLNQLLQGHNNAFQGVGLIDIRGNYICGDSFSFPDLPQEEYYTTLINRTAVIAPEIGRDLSGNEVFYFFAPVAQEGSIQFIVVGSVTAESVIHNFDSVEYTGSGCLCMMDAEGDYLLGDSNFEEMLDNQESNHFSHVGGAEAEQLEQAFEKREEITISYSYASIKYNAVYIPLSVQDWYLAATIPENQDGVHDTILSRESRIFLTVTFLFVILAVICFGLLLWKLWKLMQENTRYVLLQQCDEAVSFELSFKPHVLRFYGDLRGMIGVEPADLYGEAVYDIYDWIHEDDLSVRGRLHQFFDSDEDIFSAEIRIRNSKGNYGWYRISGVMQRDLRHKKKTRFIGRFTNVDEQVAEEKDLVQRAENDLLTGVLNKTTSERKISHMLKKRNNNYVIFYMIDLDNFKNVNDTLGHIYGDQAIVETAQALNKVFSEQDCIGRLGGDEFVACVAYQAFDEQNLLDFIKKKAQKICQVNRRTYTDGASEVSITSSVGIAYAPDMGESFEALYTKADRALYYSKENGKNRYHIYSEEDAQ